MACGEDSVSKEQETKAAESTEEKIEKEESEQEIEVEEQEEKEEEKEEPEQKEEEEPTEDELVALYTDKLNELKIEPQGVSTGEWSISVDEEGLGVTAEQSEEVLLNIYGVYDEGGIDSLLDWAKEVYAIVDELSSKVDRPFHIGLNPNCVAPYPKTINNETLMGWSGSCGYSIPILDGASKEDFSLLVDYSVFGDNSHVEQQELPEEEPDEAEAKEVVDVSVVGTWQHQDGSQSYYEFYEDGTLQFDGEAATFTGTYSVSGSEISLYLQDGSTLQAEATADTLNIIGSTGEALSFFKVKQPTSPVEADSSEESSVPILGIWTNSENNSSITFYEDLTLSTPDAKGYYSLNGDVVEIEIGDVFVTATVNEDVLMITNHTLGETTEYIRQ